MTMKTKLLILLVGAVIIVALICSEEALALSTKQTIHLRLRVVRPVALNLEDGWIQKNLAEPSAEAFHELKDLGIDINRISRNGEKVWLFTKTE